MLYILLVLQKWIFISNLDVSVGVSIHAKNKETSVHCIQSFIPVHAQVNGTKTFIKKLLAIKPSKKKLARLIHGLPG
jgi:hypothetical protein